MFVCFKYTVREIDFNALSVFITNHNFLCLVIFPQFPQFVQNTITIPHLQNLQNLQKSKMENGHSTNAQQSAQPTSDTLVAEKVIIRTSRSQ